MSYFRKYVSVWGARCWGKTVTAQSCNELKNSAIRKTLWDSASTGCWSALTEQMMCDWAEHRCEQRLPVVVLDQYSAGGAARPPPSLPELQPNCRGLLRTLRANMDTLTCWTWVGPSAFRRKRLRNLLSSFCGFIHDSWVVTVRWRFKPSHALQVLSERFPWTEGAGALWRYGL